jgi:hypothetical protein
MDPASGDGLRAHNQFDSPSPVGTDVHAQPMVATTPEESAIAPATSAGSGTPARTSTPTGSWIRGRARCRSASLKADPTQLGPSPLRPVVTAA